MWPVNQLGYCKNNEAGREVTAVRVVPTCLYPVCTPFTCVMGLLLGLFCEFRWLKISFWARGIQECTRFPSTHSRAASLINEHMVKTFRKYTRFFSKQIFLYAVSLIVTILNNVYPAPNIFAFKTRTHFVIRIC